MLQFQEVLSIHKIEFWSELTIAVLIWENVDLCFGQKVVGQGCGWGGGQDLDVGSTFRI